MQDFPRKLPEKLRLIRERTGLSPDAFASRVGARNGAAITSYEDDTGELPVSVLHGYAKLAGIPIENLVEDHLDLGFWSTMPNP